MDSYPLVMTGAEFDQRFPGPMGGTPLSDGWRLNAVPYRSANLGGSLALQRQNEALAQPTYDLHYWAQKTNGPAGRSGVLAAVRSGIGRKGDGVVVLAASLSIDQAQQLTSGLDPEMGFMEAAKEIETRADALHLPLIPDPPSAMRGTLGAGL